MRRASNMVQIVGHLGADPNSGTAGSSTPYLYFPLAENDSKHINDDHSNSPNTRWHDCIAWGAPLTKLLKDLRKGDRLLVLGSLDYDQKTIDGKKLKLAKIIVSDFEHMSPERS